MTAPEIIAIITAAGTTIGTVITVYYKQKRGAQDRHERLIKNLERRMNDLKSYQDVSVQKLNGMLSYLIHSFGRPAWLKVARETPHGVEFRMMELNQDYAQTFGIERLNYIGKTDLEAGWPLNVANAFRAHDLTVWASGEAVTVVEDVNGMPMRFRKIRVQSAGGELKGIFAYAVDCDEPETCRHFGRPIDKLPK